MPRPHARHPSRPYPAHRLLIVALLVTLAACSALPKRAPSDARLTPNALASQLAAAATPRPLTPSATPRVVNAGEPPGEGTPRAILSPAPDRPGEPPPYASRVTDLSSAPLAGQARTNADHFDANLMERPLSAEELSYLGYLDIAPGAVIAFDDTWLYATISLIAPPPKEAVVNYGIEIDLNFDGRGDWFILTSNPPGATWETGSAKAYLDNNRDVGGRTPMKADDQPGDGYEVLAYGPGVGQDPEALWSRRSPANPADIQIAFKRAIVGGVLHFAWSAWADAGPMRPEWFDYNDHFSIEQAGSPLIYSRHYPPRDLIMVDNTCRAALGSAPAGFIPGLCRQAFPTVTPTHTPTPEIGDTP